MSRDERNTLLNSVLPLAQDLLKKQKGFLPFAAAISATGETCLIAGAPDGETPGTHHVLDLLVRGLQ